MKKIEYAELSRHLSPVAMNAYSNSDLDIRENEDGTLRVSLYGTDVIGRAWDYPTLEAYLTDTEEAPTVEVFVANLFENYTGNPVGMTVDQADDDLRGFRREGWNLPTDITPERYAEEWNRLTAEVEDGNE